ncbi:MAG: hypothetical protein LBI96_07310, partial [Odoribacteraceae bacterium]|nr:hypothetical protein [Odoribacteraceae bacterium]
MRKKLTTIAILTILLARGAGAQSMPVVFDNRYGDNGKTQQLTFVAKDQVAFTGQKDGGLYLTWINRDGAVIFSKIMAGFTEINQLKELADGNLLVVGQSTNLKARIETKDKTIPAAAPVGRVLIIGNDGEVLSDLYVGDPGTSLLQGEMTGDHNLFLAGHEQRPDGKRRGVLLKISPAGKTIYKYVSPHGSVCSRFAVLGSATEYVCAAFSTDEDAAAASLVRLDHNGKPYYMTILPAKGFTCKEINVSAMDGSMLAIGHSPSGGGIIYKVRPEGDIVFAKTIVPPATATASLLEYLDVSRGGAILVGGNDGSQGYYAMLRPDGTTLFSRRVTGGVTALRVNATTGEAIVTTYDPLTAAGARLKLSDGGKVEFEKTLDGLFNNIRIIPSGETMLLSSSEGRASVYSTVGEQLSDGYITGKKPATYDGTLIATSGEAIFWGMNNRVVKLGHGLYISDVKI